MTEPETSPTTIEHTIEVAATPTTAFELWTTADGFSSWWGTATMVDPRPGGELRVVVDDEHVMRGEYVELDAPRKVVFTFGWEDGDPPAGSTIVEVTISPIATGSRLVLRHEGLPGELLDAHDQGWTHFLEIAARVAEGAR